MWLSENGRTIQNYIGIIPFKAYKTLLYLKNRSCKMFIKEKIFFTISGKKDISKIQEAEEQSVVLGVWREAVDIAGVRVTE